MLRSQVVRASKRIFQSAPLRELLERAVRIGIRLNPSLRSLFQDDPSAYGAVVPIDVSQARGVAELLDEIPSESTQEERRFLYRFFATTWEGRGSVLEVGPFLGGTTRAIGLGMLENPRRPPSARLYTYDRFGAYYESEALTRTLAPFVARGVLDDALMADVRRTRSWRGVFDRLHAGHSYTDILSVVDQVLPDTAEEDKALPNLLRVPPGVKLDAVFVDGAKSWYGTRALMLETLPRTSLGSYFIFQDYGWYTCFWLPVFLGVMSDCFRLVAYVDGTYTFQLHREPAPGEVARRFPATPAELGRPAIDEVFARLQEEAARRSDRREVTVLGMQHGAALATLGLLDDARSTLDALLARELPASVRTMVEAARKSPTYLPGGEPIQL